MTYRLMAVCALVALAVTGSVGDARAERGVTLRLGTLAVDGSRYMKDIRAMSAQIEKRTRGKLRLKWYPNGRLGDEIAMVDLMKDSRLDGGGFSDAGLTALVPEMRVWQYPGLFGTHAEVDRATERLVTEFRQLFAKADVNFVMWADLGFARVFSTSKIDRLAALESTTLWLDPADAGTLYASEQFGLSARAAPGDGLFAAIAGGHATTWLMPPLYALASSAVASATHLWELRYRYVVGGLVITAEAWSRLSESQQAVMVEVCAQWEPKIRKRWRRESDLAVSAIHNSGVTLVGASAAEKNSFHELSAANREAYARNFDVEDLMTQIVAAIDDD